MTDMIDTNSRTTNNTKHLIDVREWKAFHLYDDCMFGIDMGTKMDKAKMKELHPTVNFVGRANTNNGITTCVDKVDGVEPYPEGYMTLSLGGEYLGSCFIQPKPFYTSQNVVVLIPNENMTDNVKHFIATMIFKTSRTKYKAFVDELNRHIKTDFEIRLPTDSNGQPDWDYMESYMKAVMEKCEKTLENLKRTDDAKHLIDVRKWGEFRVGDLFDISRPIARSTQKYEKGNIAFVASGCFNNGVVDYLKPKDEKDYDEGNCLTISPVDGYTFYQKDRFLGRGGAGSSIIILRNDMLNELRGQYLSTVIRFAGKAWNYANMSNKAKLADTIINLPITSTGEPDWQYMESYMKSVMNNSEQTISNLSIATQ